MKFIHWIVAFKFYRPTASKNCFIRKDSKRLAISCEAEVIDRINNEFKDCYL